MEEYFKEYFKLLSEFYADLERDYNERTESEDDSPMSNPFEEEWWEIKDRRNNELQDI